MDHTLVLAKVEDIHNIMKQFNSFHKSIQFTTGKFQDGMVHFLDIKINGSETDLCYKTTHTGQYCNFSQTPWKSKISWIKALDNRVTKICFSNKLLNDQINRIKHLYPGTATLNTSGTVLKNVYNKRRQQFKRMTK